MATNKFKRGGVSMFLVIVAGSLVALVVASFLRLIIRDQQGASNSDLSQSAYDSAQAGVEDAKRALLIYQKTCADATKANECSKMRAELSKDLNAQSCRILAEVFGIGDLGSSETIVQTNAEDSSLNQAYTCVKINPTTANFEGELNANSSKIIPLKSDRAFRFVKISWHTKADNNNVAEVKLPSSDSDMLEVFAKNIEWESSKFPSVVRAQIITSGSFDYSNYIESDKNISKTAFLFPSSSGVSDAIISAQSSATRHNFSKDSLSSVRCNNSSNSATYACSAMIDLGSEISPDAGALMKISAQYGATTNYSIELFDSSRGAVNFDGVQPLIDSTGRASDKFRRVQSRVEMNSTTLPIPDFAVSTDGKFCKAMIVRDSTEPSTIECK